MVQQFQDVPKSSSGRHSNKKGTTAQLMLDRIQKGTVSTQNNALLPISMIPNDNIANSAQKKSAKATTTMGVSGRNRTGTALLV